MQKNSWGYFLTPFPQTQRRLSNKINTSHPKLEKAALTDGWLCGPGADR